MASARDVIAELAALHAEEAKRIARQPTGVTPGWNAGLNATVGEDGRLLYVGGSGAPNTLLAMYRVATDYTIANSGSPIKIDFDDRIYDYGWEHTSAYVTTGSGWQFIAPATGRYYIDCSISVQVLSGEDWVVGDTGALSIGGTGTSQDVAYFWDKDVTGHSIQTSFQMHGFFTLLADAGDEIWAKFANNSGFDRKIVANSQIAIWRVY